MLADFANTTEDPIFDDTLKQAISVQLARHPQYSLERQDSLHTEADGKTGGYKANPGCCK